MEYNPSKNEIVLNRELNKLDKFVIDFCNLLDDYVLVSGYVSILFGRSRATEDVDLLVPQMSYDKFRKLWIKINENGFECINTDDTEEAFLALKEHNIRFSRKGIGVPNMEFKTIRNDLGMYSFKKRLKVIMKAGSLFISPIEMQIAYKLSLTSNKDLEDAKHLYVLFNEKINKEELAKLISKFKVNDKFEIIKKEYGNKFRSIK